jgi:hypothetical protein
MTRIAGCIAQPIGAGLLIAIVEGSNVLNDVNNHGSICSRSIWRICEASAAWSLVRPS